MKSIKIGVELSPDEYLAIQKLADNSGISKSEYLRLLIQGITIGEKLLQGESVQFGGYGYSFKPDEMENLFKDVSEKLEKAVVKTPTIGCKSVRYKRIKTPKKVA
jgi:hypothetical protein